MGKRLYVGNLTYEAADHDLQGLFEAHGQVVSARVVTKQDSGRSKGFGFVEMGSEEEAQAAIAALNGQEYGGRALKVDVEKSQPRRPVSTTDSYGGHRDRGGRNRW